MEQPVLEHTYHSGADFGCYTAIDGHGCVDAGEFVESAAAALAP